MIRTLTTLAAALLLPALTLAQTTEFGTVVVVQNDAGNNTTSVTLSKGPGSSPNFTISSGNRGDYDMDFMPGNDPSFGILIPCVSELSRDNTAKGDTIGAFYATASSGPDTAGGTYYWIAIHTSPGGGEANINASAGFFPYSKWVCGVARNTANNGEMTSLEGTSGLLLNTHFTDLATPVGQYTLNINSFASAGVTSVPANAAANGVLLVSGAKNEDNYALSQANSNGTFSIFCHDNGANGTSYENDGVGFVYFPTADATAGKDGLRAIGRVNGNASLDVSSNYAGANITVTKGSTGIWYLQIAGHSPSTGTLLISPEGGVGNNIDNVVSFAWESANNRWRVESRDLPDVSMPLQDMAAADDVFSFAFFAAPNLPQVTLTSPTAGANLTAPASVAIAATASDTGGSITKVEFLRNGLVVNTDTDAPYEYTDTAPAGRHVYEARATDNDNFTATSTSATVLVQFDPNNIPANTAVSFDGVNDYVTMGVAPELGVGGPPTNGLTLECWFRKEGAGLTASSGSGGIAAVPLIARGRGESDGGTQDCNYLFGITAAGKLACDFESYQTGDNHPVTAGAAQPAIVNGQWYHAAVVFDGNAGTWKLYLDGAEVGSGAVQTAGRIPRYDSVQHFGLGAAFNTAGVPEGAFAGTIDEARIWNYARSAAEIAADKVKEIGAAAGLVGRFGLNEGLGATASSTAGVTMGTLTNGPIWVDGAPFTNTNVSPTISLVAPVNDASSYMPYPVTFEAAASDSDGSIVKVEFWVNGAKVGEDTTAEPNYTYSWTPPAVGAYTVSARAQDNLGAWEVTTAVTLNIEVNPNQAPTVTLTAPAADATVTGTSAALNTSVVDPEGDAMTVTFYGRHSTPTTPGPDFTVVAIPDTQYYSEGSASRANTVTVEQLVGTFGAQTQWVVDNKAARNIAFVSHMGDIVEHGNNGGNNIEWQRASAAMGRLENPVAAMRAFGIPYGLAPGNHDIDPIGSYDTGSTAFYNDFFPTSRFAGRDYWGGNYGTNNTNNYQLFSVSGLEFIAIHFAYDTTPNQPILDWADALLKAHPHRRAIVTSHYIIGQGNPASFSAQGSAIYNNLRDNPNLFLLLCGHIHAEGRRADVFQGRTVYSVLSDYQGLPNGGNGFLRTFTFSPSNNRIRVESWSPTQNRTALATDGLPHFDGAFDLAYNMQTPISDWVALGTVNVAAGDSTAAFNWTGLEADKTYEWYAAASDAINVASSSSRRFTTAGGTPPTITLDAPTDGATVLTPNPIIFNATANDTDGSVARVEFYNGGTKVGEDTDAPYTFTMTGVVPGSYTVSALAVDDAGLSAISNAATVTVEIGDHLPTVTLTAPTNGDLLAGPATVTLEATAADNEGQVAKVEFFSGLTSLTLLGEDTTAPYELALPDLGAGAYTFTAKVTDAVGQTGTSASVNITIFVEAPRPNTATASVGLFNPPTWTVTKTGPVPLNFNLPGTDVGDIALKINGVSVPFTSGVALCSNWDNPANVGITSDDNLSQPYSGTSGNLFVSVLDNSNNNAADGNPGTSEQTAGTAVAFLPYSAGWTGASINSGGGIISGNVPAGVSVTKTGTGTYTINGLATTGNMIAVTNGDSGTLADNVCSVRVQAGKWVVDTRDNGVGLQDNESTFVYIPNDTTGVYAGYLATTGAISNTNASATALGVTASVTASYYELTFGDGTVINPDTAALFLVGDATVGGAGSAATDNLISWSASGNKFRIFSQDLPEINGTFQATNMRFLAVPFNPPAPAVTTLAATNLTPTSATLNAIVNPNGNTASALFQHGQDSSYGVDTPIVLNPDNGIVDQAVSTDLTNLTPGTEYHFRVASSGLGGVSEGTDMSFITPAIPVIGFGADTYEVLQGATSVDLVLNRIGFVGPLSVTIQTDNGIASTVPPFSAAVAPTDYTDLQGDETTVEFGLGEMTKTVTVTLLPKTGMVTNKRFSATISAPTGGAVLGAITTANVHILSNDTTKPTVTITAPGATPNLSATAPFLAGGTTGDNRGVDRVEVVLNGAPAILADLGTAMSAASIPWSATIEPTPGPNTLEVTSFDLRGNNTTVTRNFNFTRRYVFTLAREAPAGIALDTAGTVLMGAHESTDASALTPATANSNPRTSQVVPGTIIKLTATPKTGYVFSDWSGTPAGTTYQGNVVVFTMPAEDVGPITATFAANPFAAPAGASNLFYGLLTNTGTGGRDNSTEGFISGTITPTSGNFSGKIVTGGVSKSFIAYFYGDGSATFDAKREPVLRFDGRVLDLQFVAGAIEATLLPDSSGGSAGDGEPGGVAPVVSSFGILTRGVYSAANKVAAELLNQKVPATAAAPNKGFFSFAVPAKEQTSGLTASEFPQGTGYGTITLSDNGTLTLGGTLADGSTFTGASGLVEDDMTPFYAQLTTPGAAAAVKGGSFLGMLAFDTTEANSDLLGVDLAWFRPAVTPVTSPATAAAATNLYTDGWPEGIVVDAFGALFDKTLTVQAGLGIGAAQPTGNAQLFLLDGKLTAPIVKTNFNIVDSKVTKIPATDASFTVTVSTTTAGISGTFTPNWAAPNTTKPGYKGIMIQKGANKGGHGFFIGNAKNDLDPESGKVILQANP